MGVTEEGEHVVFAHGIELDIPDQHHVLVRFFEYRIPHYFPDAVPVPTRQPPEGCFDTRGRLPQAGP